MSVISSPGQRILLKFYIPPSARTTYDKSEAEKHFCTVGGNAVSAFLSWRLQATNACDVTLVWKNGFESVSQYGISFRYVTLSIYSSRIDH